MRQVTAWILAVFLAGIIVTGIAGCRMFSEEEKEGQKFCPVSGRPAEEEFSCEYKGIKIRFSDRECISRFKADPEKYLKNYELMMQGCNQRCPVCDKCINAKCSLIPDGEKIFFDSEKCKKEFGTNSAGYRQRLKELEDERLNTRPILD